MVRKHDPETKRKAFSLLRAGYKPKKVAEALDIPLGTIYRWISEDKKKEEGEALVQASQTKVGQELAIQISEVLDEIKIGLSRISAKSTADLKNLGSLLAQLCRASEQLNVPIAKVKPEYGRPSIDLSKVSLDELNIIIAKIKEIREAASPQSEED